MTIRDVTPGDLARLHEINEVNADDVGSIEPDRLRSMIEQSEIALVAETAEGVIAGFCLVLGPSSTDDAANLGWTRPRHADALYVDRIAFDMSFSGLGLGVDLYDELDRRIAAQVAAGAGTARLVVQVSVDPPNRHSIDFHAGRGFTEIGRRPGPAGGQVSLVQKKYDSI